MDATVEISFLNMNATAPTATMTSATSAMSTQTTMRFARPGPLHARASLNLGRLFHRLPFHKHDNGAPC